MTHQPTESRVPTTLLYGMAFLSGAAALIYELTWAKMLALTFGSTTLSAAAVIAGFMGGMGIGAWACHLVSDRIKKPLLFYGCLEIGIAITTALLTPLLYSLPEIFARVAAAVDQPFLVEVIRFTSVFLLLLIPSMLMGATFPALCSVMMRTVRDVDRHLGIIYGISTVGGAAGVLVGGLVLIEALGLTLTTRVANVFNLVVGMAAFALITTSLGRREKSDEESSETSIPTQLSRTITGTVLIVSGFTTLCYEILWFRALRFIVGNSTHALSTVLLIFLLGLGIGSLLLRLLLKRKSPERDLATCQWLIAVFALWAMVCETLVLSQPAIYNHVSIFLAEVRYQPWGMRLAIISLISVVMMLPATIFMGLSFPLASRLFLGDVRKLTTRIGTAYLLANLGSIAGAIFAAVTLLPWLGVTGGTKFCALLNLLLGLFMVIKLRAFGRMRIPFVSSVVVIAGLMWIVPPSLGLYGEEQAGRLAFEQEHDLGTVHVRESVRDPRKKLMLVDGCKIGCSNGYPTSRMFRKQVALVHIPMALDSRIRHTLNVGLGSASTLHTLASYPSIQSLDCVEINSGVVEGSKLFFESSVLDDPRVDLSVNDAVHYLLRSEKQYDLIISDGKQDPFFSGNATLLCKEYYHFAKQRLTEDGMFVQWISLSTLAGDFQIILRTLMNEFDHVEMFTLMPNSVIMVASRHPIFGRPLRSSQELLTAFRDLQPFGINTIEALFSRWVAGKPQLWEMVADVPVSRWDHLIMDYTPYKANELQWRHAERDNLQLLITAGAIPRNDQASQMDFTRSPFAKSTDLIRKAYVSMLFGKKDEALSLITQARISNPKDRSVDQIFRFIRSQTP